VLDASFGCEFSGFAGSFVHEANHPLEIRNVIVEISQFTEILVA